jgi:phosphatidylinositol 4-kinase
MKANCYKGDAGEIVSYGSALGTFLTRTQEDPMKPVLDRTTEMVVESLSGDAREFYDREFGFFNEVTSISGKLKPFIKRTKQEKKVRTVCSTHGEEE